MRLPRFRSTLPLIDRILDQWKVLIDPALVHPFQQGVFIEVTLSSGSNEVNHLLERVPLGFFVTDIDAAVTIYRTAWDNKIITLQASGAVTVTLFVF